MNKFIPLFLGMATIFSAHADSPTLAHIKDTGIVKIGVRTDAVPFSSYQNGQASGYMVDLCRSVTEDIEKSVGRKLTLQYVPVTPKNRFDLVQSGAIDMECGTTTVNAQRRSKVDFSLNTFITSTNFVTLTKYQIDTTHDFYDYFVSHGRRIAVMKGTSHEEIVQRVTLDKNPHIVYVNTVEDGLQKVAAGEVFAFVQDKVLIEQGINNLKLDPKMLALSQEAFSVEPYSIMTKKGDTEMTALVNGSLRKSYSSGQARQLMTQWLEPQHIALNALTLDNFKMPSTENAVN